MLRGRRLAKLLDFPGYVITDHGEIYSYMMVRGGISTGRPWKLLNGWVEKSTGYHRVALSHRDGRRVNIAVHTLVATAFHGPCPDGLECRHLNGISTDNHSSNLEWGTPLENARDRITHNTQARGQRQHCAKLTDQQVINMRTQFAGGARLRELEKNFPVSRATILDAIHRRTWTHI